MTDAPHVPMTGRRAGFLGRMDTDRAGVRDTARPGFAGATVRVYAYHRHRFPDAGPG